MYYLFHCGHGYRNGDMAPLNSNTILHLLIKERLWVRRHYTRAHGVARTEAQSITFLISSYYRNSTNNNFSGLDNKKQGIRL